MTALTDKTQTIASVQMQHRLIAFEDLSLSPETKSRRANTYPNHHEIKKCAQPRYYWAAGPDRPDRCIACIYNSFQEGLSSMIRTLLLDYNLSARGGEVTDPESNQPSV